MMRFAPKGEQSRWKLIYDQLCQMQVDDMVTYEALGKLLQLNPNDDRHQIQMAMRRAAREYLETNCRALDSVRNVGYRIVEPSEHLRLANGHNRKAGRSLHRGYEVATRVDVTGLDQAMRDALNSFALMAAAQSALNKRLARDQAKLAKALETVATKQGLSDERLARLEQRLEALARDGS